MSLFTRLTNHPQAIDPSKVGTYPLRVHSGGGYFYDDVLEYRVWVHRPLKDARCHSFATYKEALQFSRRTKDAEQPVVLVWQQECIDEPQPGHFIHVKKPRFTEWCVEWLKGTQGTKRRIPAFLAKQGRYFA